MWWKLSVQYSCAPVVMEWTRKDVRCFFASLQPCLIGMEACGSAHLPILPNVAFRPVPSWRGTIPSQRPCWIC
jgi:hypothetical protein